MSKRRCAFRISAAIGLPIRPPGGSAGGLRSLYDVRFRAHRPFEAGCSVLAARLGARVARPAFVTNRLPPAGYPHVAPEPNQAGLATRAPIMPVPQRDSYRPRS